MNFLFETHIEFYGVWGFFSHLPLPILFSFKISFKIPWNISSGLIDLCLYDSFPYAPILLCSYIFQDPCKFSNISFFNILPLYRPVIMSSLVWQTKIVTDLMCHVSHLSEEILSDYIFHNRTAFSVLLLLWYRNSHITSVTIFPIHFVSLVHFKALSRPHTS